VDVGTVRPSAFAVLRLTTSVNLVGACTARSAGFSSLRMRSTSEVASRNESAMSAQAASWTRYTNRRAWVKMKHPTAGRAMSIEDLHDIAAQLHKFAEDSTRSSWIGISGKASSGPGR
jgi:hypothetical protein